MKTKPSLKENMEATQTLVALASEAQEISKLILDAQGELSPELEKRLDFNSTSLMAKVDSYVFIEEHLEAHAALWKRKAEACKAIYDRYNKTQEKIRDRVKFVMRETDKKELSGNLHRYVLSTLKPKLVLTDPEKLPKECLMHVTTTVPDKDKIKSLLEDGIEVQGAFLEPVFSLRTYENAEE